MACMHRMVRVAATWGVTALQVGVLPRRGAGEPGGGAGGCVRPPAHLGLGQGIEMLLYGTVQAGPYEQPQFGSGFSERWAAQPGG